VGIKCSKENTNRKQNRREEKRKDKMEEGNRNEDVFER
jgi:hypothetical protein